MWKLHPSFKRRKAAAAAVIAAAGAILFLQKPGDIMSADTEKKEATRMASVDQQEAEELDPRIQVW